MVWEVDEFEGGLAGLILAEIEMPDIDYGVVLPEWLGVELTGLHQWSNSTLALTGIARINGNFVELQQFVVFHHREVRA